VPPPAEQTRALSLRRNYIVVIETENIYAADTHTYAAGARTLSSENSAADNGLMNVKPSVTYATGVAHMQTRSLHTWALCVSIFVN
jgi:hypothetical protein